MSRLLQIIFGVCVALGAHAQDASDPKAQGFIDLFLSTCVKFYGKPDTLRADLEQRRIPSIPSQDASFFLDDKEGSAWSATNSIGEYIVSLRKDGVCAVFARRARDTDVQRLFAEVVQGLPIPPMMVQKKEDKLSMTPNGPTRFISYAYAKPEAKGSLHFALTTASADNAFLQAMATLVMVRNE
jgi:hypothetical protein